MTMKVNQLNDSTCTLCHLTILNSIVSGTAGFSKNDFTMVEDDRRIRRNVFSKHQDTTKKHIIKSSDRASFNASDYPLRPRFSLSRNANLPLDPTQWKCSDKFAKDCQNKTKTFRNKILAEFRKSLTESVSDEPNFYNVVYSPEKKKQRPICQILDAKVRVLRKKDKPFDTNGFSKLFPKIKLFGKKGTMTYKSCAIISSAGSLTKSGLGHFIDLHDYVMRFNHAPTDGHENDVGRKTTIRVVNSQVVSKPEFNFINSPMFQNISIAAWDPGKFNSSLEDWLSSPDFNLFGNYKLFMGRYPQADFHLVDPRSIWKLWMFLQRYSDVKIRWNPPSSGFIGLALILPVCTYVDIIEYIPSTRLNGRCHYYDEEMNPSCTFGAWHPLAAEKLTAYDMNSADDYSVFQNGVIRIRRPEKSSCV
ncbi:hypothetical protein HA402_000711 [Bradysia odoriphaga]|nr:hypothetical protein HA402_000711 [Bradysia odoriphaga]